MKSILKGIAATWAAIAVALTLIFSIGSVVAASEAHAAVGTWTIESVGSVNDRYARTLLKVVLRDCNNHTTELIGSIDKNDKSPFSGFRRGETVRVEELSTGFEISTWKRIKVTRA